MTKERKLLPIVLDGYKPLRDVVFETLRDAIITQVLKPGERLMEIQLADEMGVSRTPVREAIRKLEKEGLVTIEPRKGAYASNISIKDMVDVLEVRQATRGPLVQVSRTHPNVVRRLFELETPEIADGQVEAAEFVVDKNTLHCGEPLKNIKIKKDALIACIIHGSKTEIPNGNSMFHVGDTLVVVTTDRGSVRQLNDIFA